MSPAWLGLAVALAAAPEPQVQTWKGLAARLEVSAQTLSLAEVLNITLTVTGPAPVQVEPVAQLFPKLAWNARTPGPEKIALPEGREQWRQVFQLDPVRPTAPNEPEKIELAPLQVRQGDETWTVTWKPVEVEVKTALQGADLGQARGVPGIEGLPPQPPGRPWAGIIGLSLAGLVGLAGAVWLIRGRRQPVEELPPHLAALAELDRIEALNLPAAGGSERYHTLLTEAIRTYLDRRFDLRSQEQTTPEFFAHLPAAPPWPAAAQEHLREFFQRCDLAKFAGVGVAPAECRRAAESARAFVQTTPAQ